MPSPSSKNPFGYARKAAETVIDATAKVVSVKPGRSPFSGSTASPPPEGEPASTGASATESGRAGSGDGGLVKVQDPCMVCGGELSSPDGLIVVRVCRECVDGGMRVVGFFGKLSQLAKKIGGTG